ncbi:unnamed protein product [Rotaria socialis]|uniref:VWFA domain-containing protein n=1 Tax=Rotaria socialis TaxID=392032 RepID=A0A820N9J1_9BILA|nr:unnamed protein product [Rotaria socialis]CAF4386359.1 unnamed protein product [Rotaria socialis]
MAEASSTATTANLPTELDLAFIIDATGSMGSYIKSAQENMRNIVQDIIISEKCLLNVALILYRDHPPQDSTFIIKVNNFTDDMEEAKANIDLASASGGGDGPEAMTPALHAAAHTLSWRTNAVKIAILIADAPPHGLDVNGDHWPNGDPSGHDPIECVALLAEHGITLYTIGCEPAATVYRDFLMALAFKTGGQYIPLDTCANLASVIVGSAKEEISLERLIAQVHEEVMREAALRGGPVDETKLTRRLHEVMESGGVKARRVKMDNQDGTKSIPSLTPTAEYLSTLTTLKEVRDKWVANKSIPTAPVAPTLFGGIFGASKTPAPTSIRTKKARVRTRVIKKKSVKTGKTATKVKTIVKKKKAKRSVGRGIRRSTRIAFRGNHEEEEEEESTENEEMETSTLPAAKPAKMIPHISHITLADDELLDVSQTRRLSDSCDLEFLNELTTDSLADLNAKSIQEKLINLLYNSKPDPIDIQCTNKLCTSTSFCQADLDNIVTWQYNYTFINGSLPCINMSPNDSSLEINQAFIAFGSQITNITLRCNHQQCHNNNRAVSEVYSIMRNEFALPLNCFFSIRIQLLQPHYLHHLALHL